MADQVLNAMKFAVAGTVVGVTAGLVADQLNMQVLNKIMSPTGNATPASQIGRAAFQVVACAGLSAAVIYGGDLVMNAVGPEGQDPLFRLFYYQIAFHTSGTSFQGARAFRGLLNAAINQVSSPANNPPPVRQAKPAGSSCGGGCGGGKSGICNC